jgi:hypothetical protein
MENFEGVQSDGTGQSTQGGENKKRQRPGKRAKHGQIKKALRKEKRSANVKILVRRVPNSGQKVFLH